MTPAARYQAVIEILSDIEAALRNNGAAADVILRKAFAARRYAGSKDRNSITDSVYQILRRRGLLSWQLAQAGEPVTGRHLLLAYLNTVPDIDLASVFSGVGHAPEPLTGEESLLIQKLGTLPDAPLATRLECPDWLEDQLRSRFGDAFEEGLRALQDRAQLTLRVNGLRANPQAVLQALEALEIEASPGLYLEDAIRIEGSPRLDGLSLVRDGWVEVQDEASQIGAYLVDAKPKMQIADLCAGAGGKALALASHMKNSGQLYAFDSDTRRLGNMRDRIKRADARNIQMQVLPLDREKRSKILKSLGNSMDRVLLDVPCSGSGTWRRSPELRWRLTAENLTELTKIQDSLLDEGAALVKPGGRLIYMTCSLLESENETRISSFLERNKSFVILDYRDAWSAAPDSLSGLPGCLSLAPHTHKIDGFFIVILAQLAK